MESIQFVRVALPVSLVGIFVLAMVWPVLRARRTSGGRSVVVHETPVQRAIGVAMATLIVGVGMWGGLVALVGPEALGTWSAPGSVHASGWALVLLGLVVTVIAQWQMGASWRIGIDARPTSLVDGGLFRLVRNPIYAGILAALGGVALVTPSAWTVSLFADAALVIGVQTRLEEAHLLALHGDSYRDYARRVGRFVPGIGLFA